MKKYNLEVGQRFGKWTVVRLETGNFVLARCDCGEQRRVNKYSLLYNISTNCGCVRNAKTVARNIKHGYSKTRLYGIWKGMRKRCHNPHNKRWSCYGGRGICVCKEWDESFVAFKLWADTHGYKDTLTIERVDVNGNYCPENCTWIPLADQAKNRRTKRKAAVERLYANKPVRKLSLF